LPLTARFFVPGFTRRTGGLLRERTLLEQRDRFQGDPEQIARFLARIGQVETVETQRITLFCYADAELDAFRAWLASAPRATSVFVPPGQPRQALARSGLELGTRALALPGTPHVRFVPLPMLAQDDFDRLLWSCDFNWVRGEDSFVRAQWSGRPFLWHPYRQERNAHLPKLDAFLDHYLADAPAALGDSISRLFQRSNRGEETAQDWGWSMATTRSLASALPPLVPPPCSPGRPLHPAARLHCQKRDKMIVYFQRNCGKPHP